MAVSNPLGLSGNAIALAVLCLKTFHDLLWNPRIFKRELLDHDPIVAARRKRERSDNTTAWTFFALAISQLILIVETLQ